MSACRQLPLISVVTPSFNQGEYLEACIDSVLSQNYPFLEYVIIDGGSTDNSVAIIKKYERHLAYWHSRPDDGHYAAVNFGFSKTSGEVMGWLNSDDMLYPKGLHIVGEVMQSHPEVKVLTGRRIGFNSDGSMAYFGFEKQRWCRDVLLDPENALPPVHVTPMQEGTYWRRSLWDRAGGRLRTEFAYAADYDLWVRFSNYEQIYSVDALIGGFRCHSDDQRSQHGRNNYFEECVEICNEAKAMKPPNPDWATIPPPLVSWPIRSSNEQMSAREPSTFSSSGYLFTSQYETPLISIVVTSHNQIDYLETCLDSLLSQRYPKLECIVVDGGSTDGSVEFLKRHEQHIHCLISAQDSGLFDGLNQGFSHSHGEIMGWLPGDDLARKGSLFIIEQIYQTSDVAWIAGRPNAVNAEGHDLWDLSYLPIYCEEQQLQGAFDQPWIPRESTFWTKQLWEKAGCGFDSTLKYAGDFDLWLRFFQFTPLVSVNFSLAAQRIHERQWRDIFATRHYRECYSVIQRYISELHTGQKSTLQPPAHPIIEL